MTSIGSIAIIEYSSNGYSISNIINSNRKSKTVVCGFSIDITTELGPRVVGVLIDADVACVGAISIVFISAKC